MALIRWQPFRELDVLHQQMNRLFEDLLQSEQQVGSLTQRNDRTWAPAIELQETETELILRAEIPGVDAKDLDVQVSQDAVVIAGEHQEEQRSEVRGMVRSEFRYGQFRRVVPLPIAIQNEQVQAEFQNGILMLRMPKVESTRRNIVKIDLTMQEKAREAVTQQRQHEEHLRDTSHLRAASDLQLEREMGTQAEAQKSVAEQRQSDQTSEPSIPSMSDRSPSETGMAGTA